MIAINYHNNLIPVEIELNTMSLNDKLNYNLLSDVHNYCLELKCMSKTDWYQISYH